MAQRTEKEETEFKVVPETISLCINNCGVVGNPSTNNMCQNCFNARSTTSTSSSSAKFSDQSRRSSSPRSLAKSPESEDIRRVPISLDRGGEAKETVSVVKRVLNRCSGCRKKVGMTGFRCRCGDLFCAKHRYSDRHDCSYDYKAAGRETIARENPVVKAAKIVRI